MATISTIRDKIHAGIDTLENLKNEIVALNIDPDTAHGFHLLKNHIQREFNKQCTLKGETDLMFEPIDAGCRPISPVIDEGGNVILIAGDGNILTIDGDTIIRI